MPLFLGFIIIICAIGLVLKYRAFIKEQNKFNVQQAGCFSGCVSHTLIWIYLLGSFVLIIGYFSVAKTYYDFLSLDLLMMTLFAVFISAIFGSLFAELIMPVPIIHFHSRKQQIIYLSCFSIILFFGVLLIFTFLLPSTVETTEGLLNGPNFMSGIVEEKSRSISRSGTSYYIDINGESKHIPDANWWYSLEKGDEIQYIHNPHATTMSNIFQPNQIDLTIPGIILIVINSIFWFLTIWLAWTGITNSINRDKISTMRVKFRTFSRRFP